MKAKGFTLVELLIFISVLVIIGSVIFGFIANNRGFTENRAYDNAYRFVAENNMDVLRVTCAGDSDGDGYGSCTVVTKNVLVDANGVAHTSEGSKIRLDCPSDFVNVNIWRARSCREVFNNFGITPNTTE